MKFKQSDGQNQRIERITTSHLVVGIDMAKETHVAQATNFRGVVLTNWHLSFKNTHEGFEKLKQWMETLQQKHRLNSLIIGMEPTGHYSNNLANWLVGQGLNVVFVNPATMTSSPRQQITRSCTSINSNFYTPSNSYIQAIS